MIVRDERGRILKGSGGRPKGAGNRVKKPVRREEDRRDFRLDAVAFVERMRAVASEQVVSLAVWLLPFIYRAADDYTANATTASATWPDELRSGLRGLAQHLTLFPKAMARAFDVDTLTPAAEADLMTRAHAALAQMKAKARDDATTPAIADAPAANAACEANGWRIDYGPLMRHMPRQREPVWSILDGRLVQ